MKSGKNLVQEFGKQCGIYFSILDQIVHGSVLQSDIEASLGMKTFGGQLKFFREEIWLHKKKRPVGAKTGYRTVRNEI